MSDGKRAFMMGNALVVGVVERIADELIKEIATRRSTRRSSDGRRVVAPWPGSNSRTRRPRVRPFATSCGPTVRATPGRNCAYAARLRDAGLGGYRLNWKKAPGRPDIAYPGRKLAIFVHGCYWHHCPRCYPNLPKSNPEFWARKFELNRERDARKRRVLEIGWLGRLRGLGVRYP